MGGQSLSTGAAGYFASQGIHNSLCSQNNFCGVQETKVLCKQSIAVKYSLTFLALIAKETPFL